MAFYLPQFHPIAENDAWWGRGFTEWRNVARATAKVRGQRQPQLPADLGFYDLRLEETRRQQAQMAREYGLHGFCYYHYWFNGRRVLERPFEEVLRSGDPDLPFCLCWANENWTRIWDGGSQHMLLEQRYSAADDHAHAESLLPAFCDPRYVRVDGRPMFLIYRTALLPDPAATAKRWRDVVRAHGLADLYLVRVESHADFSTPQSLGFDAAVEFAPFNGLGPRLFRTRLDGIRRRLALLPRATGENNYYRYADVARRMSQRPRTEFECIPCVTPGWDNTARRRDGATVLLDATPAEYCAWLQRAVHRAQTQLPEDRRFVFINAWNEWAEGNHLEPDLDAGLTYLEATRQALLV